MAENSEKKSVQKAGHKKPVFWVLVFIGCGTALFPPTLLVLLSGMIPSIVAALLNTSRIGGNLASMIALNLSGVIPVLGILWQRGHNFDEAFLILSDPYMWLAMFGGAAIATFLSWGVPIFVFAVYEVKAKAAARKLMRQRGKLLEEWGDQLAEDAKARTSGIN